MPGAQSSLSRPAKGRRVLVTGGSVAATTLAYWLLEGGFDVTMVEKAPKFRDGGQSVDVRGAGRDVLDRMDATAEVDRSGTGETGWTFVDDEGEVQAAFEVADVGGDGPTAQLEILRGDLAKIVFDKVKDRAEVRFGDSIAAVDDHGDSVQVRFEGAREEDYDLVLVAEGVGSSTRELVFPGQNDPRWMDMTIAYFTIPRAEDDGTDGRWYNAPGGRVVFLRPDQYGTTWAVLMLRHQAREAPDLSHEEQVAWLKETFADAGWEAPRVLEALDAADDLYFEVLRQVRMPAWSMGRIGLTGDAAWCATPISGIGTTLAVVGSYVLAGELTKTKDHAEAFAAYEGIMRPFVEEGQGTSKANQFWTHPKTRFGIALQHAVLGVLAKPGIRDLFLKVGMRESDAVDVPQYEFDEEPTAAGRG